MRCPLLPPPAAPASTTPFTGCGMALLQLQNARTMALYSFFSAHCPVHADGGRHTALCLDAALRALYHCNMLSWAGREDWVASGIIGCACMWIRWVLWPALPTRIPLLAPFVQAGGMRARRDGASLPLRLCHNVSWWPMVDT